MSHKRPFSDSDEQGNPSEEKRIRPSLLDFMLKELEPMLRRVVSEEVDRAISRYIPSKLGTRLPPKQLHGSESTCLRLQFQNKLAQPLYTGCKVEGENGNAIRVFLQDTNTGEIVVVDDESSVQLDIVVLEGDFPYDDEEDWSQEEFENHVVKEREGKRPLLSGELSIQLREGIATLGELIFTDNSSWIRSRKFRLGVKLSNGSLNGSRVREAKTEPFFVKDHRGQLYKKHYPPNLNDEVWRLEKIGKDGAYHKRLSEYSINTVKDFLVLYTTGQSRLREIFGATMSTKTWDCILEHAKTCVLDETQHVFYPDEGRSIGVVLNTIYQPLGIIRNGSYVPSSSLSDTEQVYMDRLVQEAYSDPSNICTLPAKEKHQEVNDITRNGHVWPVNGCTTQSQYGCTLISAERASSVMPTNPQTSIIGVTNRLPMAENYYVPDTYNQSETEAVEKGIHFNKHCDDYSTGYCQGKVYCSFGDDYSFRNTSSGTICAFQGSVMVLNGRRNNLQQKAYLGWVKLKAILKWFSLMKKKEVPGKSLYQNA